MLKQRVITALWTLPLLFAAIRFDYGQFPIFTLFVAVWGLLAVLEFYRLVAVSRAISLASFGLVWTLLFILSPHVDNGLFVPAVLTSAIILSMILVIFRPQREGAFAQWAWTIAGILYVGWLLSYLVALREAGRAWVYIAILTTFGTDTAAYFIGTAFGKRKLAPRISPAKTWEGAIAGLFGSIAVALLLVALFEMPFSLTVFGVRSSPIGYLEAAVLGLAVSVFAQLGGLALSLFKRNVGVKDSGTLIPGHGGVLDRTDSIAFAGIVVYYWVVLVASL